MKVHFDGNWYDPDTQEEALREAIRRRAESVVRSVGPDNLEPALVEFFSGATIIAVKLGATAALHHAYAQPVDHDLVDVFAHSLNKLVGLNYTPPQGPGDTSQENDSGSTDTE